LGGIDRLHVICPKPNEDAARAAGALARLGGGTYQGVRRLAEVGPALSRVLAMG
jgi:hypothetical protein